MHCLRSLSREFFLQCSRMTETHFFFRTALTQYTKAGYLLSSNSAYKGKESRKTGDNWERENARKQFPLQYSISIESLCHLWYQWAKKCFHSCLARIWWFWLQFSSKKLSLHGNSAWILTLSCCLAFVQEAKYMEAIAHRNPHISQELLLWRHYCPISLPISVHRQIKHGYSSQPAASQERDSHHQLLQVPADYGQ